MAVCLQWKTIIKQAIFEVDVNSKTIFDRPEYNIQWLEVNVKVE